MSTCPMCHGKGYVECHICSGTGRKWPDIMDYGILRGLDPTCNECEGTGHIKCPWCDGEGYREI